MVPVVAVVAEASPVMAVVSSESSVVAVASKPSVVVMDGFDKQGWGDVSRSYMVVEAGSNVGWRSVVRMRSGLKTPHTLANNIILRCLAVVFARLSWGLRVGWEGEGLGLLILLMLFDGEEEKGLFTFYREQAQQEEEFKELRRERRRRRLQREEPMVFGDVARDITPPLPPRAYKLSPGKAKLPKQTSLQLKPSHCKHRLIESVVDMGKQMQEERPQVVQPLPSSSVRFPEPAFVSRARKYHEKVEGMRMGKVEECGLEGGDMLVESLHRRNLSEEWVRRGKQVIHSARGSVVELPEIRRAEEVKVPYRAKRSLKSRLIQEALQTKDRAKIQQIRLYMKGVPQMQQRIEENQEELEECYEVFEMRQKKLQGILRRFKGV